MLSLRNFPTFSLSFLHGNGGTNKLREVEKRYSNEMCSPFFPFLCAENLDFSGFAMLRPAEFICQDLRRLFSVREGLLQHDWFCWCLKSFCLRRLLDSKKRWITWMELLSSSRTMEWPRTGRWREGGGVGVWDIFSHDGWECNRLILLFSHNVEFHSPHHLCYFFLRLLLLLSSSRKRHWGTIKTPYPTDHRHWGERASCVPIDMEKKG